MDSFVSSPDAADPSEALHLLDDHHLVAVGGSPLQRRRWAEGLAHRLECLDGTRVVMHDSGDDSSIEALARSIARAFGVHTPRGGQAFLRLGRSAPDGVKRVFLVWKNADAMLESSVEDFGEAVNGLLAAAVEQEHLGSDRLVLERVVFLGGEKLGAYAEESEGQFRQWLLKNDAPLWEIAACVDRPPVLIYRLEG